MHQREIYEVAIAMEEATALRAAVREVRYSAASNFCSLQTWKQNSLQPMIQEREER